MLPLERLARLYHVETGYVDIFGQPQRSPPEALLETLRALGAPLGSLDDVPEAIRERRLARWRRPLEPFLVFWEGSPARVVLRVAEPAGNGRLHLHLALESGEVRSLSRSVDDLRRLRAVEVEGERFQARELPLPSPLPFGYHRLTLELSARELESHLVVAPRKAFLPPTGPSRLWGVFLPLYALHSKESWGAGDFSDLERLTGWLAEQGAGLFATVPFLAAFLDEPFDPSPYAPASRLFWNEFYVDARRSPELSRCPRAQTLLASARIQREIEELRGAPQVDYRRQMALKRKILEPLSRCFFKEGAHLSEDYRRFVASDPRVEDYAAFRAASEVMGANWREWPKDARDGRLKAARLPRGRMRYHLYVQWLAHQQIESLTAKAGRDGLGLYLDMPLGAHPDGYDVWRERAAFALETSTGAPPDDFFSLGQDWGFPPLHPERIREQGYRYVIESLRHQMHAASLLRIDHVMGLYRLFWVPRGMEPRDGVYVRYRAEEFYAILMLESHRQRCALVGEDLGTVPESVDRALARHGIRSMYVLQFEIQPEAERALSPVPANTVASLNTHDTPTFAGYCQGLDIEDRVTLGLLEKAKAPLEHEIRRARVDALVKYLKREGFLRESSEEGGALVRAALAYLSESSAPVVLVNLEDLWEETEPQNVPGLIAARPSWRRKARYSIEALCQMPRVVETMRDLNQLNK
jgi:4-alpha-glucanotransferase